MEKPGKIDQTFMPGYIDPRHRRYMNIGYVRSPYPGKVGEGDYGPSQGGEVYYRPENPVYYVPMDKDETVRYSAQFVRENPQKILNQGYYQ